MSNLRVIFDNALDRAATLTADKTATGLPIANVKSNIKSEVYRSTAKDCMITITWTTLQQIKGVILPFTNLTAQARLTVKGYTGAADTTPVYDSGQQFAVGAQPLGAFGWGDATLGVNSFTWAGSAYARHWLESPIAVAKIEILLSDITNAANLEVGRLILGQAWEPERNADWGAQVMVEDMSEHRRSEAGGLRTNAGPKYRKVALNFSALSDSDRLAFFGYLMAYGKTVPILLSVFPENADTALEQAYMLFGKLSDSASVSAQFFNMHSASVEIEEI